MTLPPPSDIAAFDVAYVDDVATVAGVGFDDWFAPRASYEHVITMQAPAPYVPGEFYRRELPCILRVLEKLPRRPRVIVVDSFVWLGPNGEPGLGAHLWRHLRETIAVVGVAKSPFRASAPCVELRRGASNRPLFVSAAGMSSEDAAAHVASMHGPHRVPTLLRRVDQLSRGAGAAPP